MNSIIIVKRLRGQGLPQKEGGVLVGKELGQAIQGTAPTEGIQDQTEHHRPRVDVHLCRHQMINEPHEPQLIGVGLDKGKVLHGVCFDLGWYVLHVSLHKWLTGFSPPLAGAAISVLWGTQCKNTIGEKVFITCQRGAEHKL